MGQPLGVQIPLRPFLKIGEGLKAMFQLFRNYRMLKKALIAAAPEFEGLPYDELLVPAEKAGAKKTVDGKDLLFSVRQNRLEKNGDICVCIDAEGLPTPLGVAPSWRFHKRKDGTVYY